jgi:cytochrome c oxidase subunit 2
MTRLETILAAGLALALAAGPGAGRAGAEASERGKALFSLCAQCHGPTAAGDPAFLAPAIAGLELWYVEAQLGKFRGGIRGTHFDDLPGMRMRPMSLSLRTEEDLKAVAAYVASLPPADPPPLLEGGDPGRGQALYATCSACHGPDGSGNPALSSPALRHQSDWYLVSSLERFKSGVRGSNPQDATGALMRPMALTLPDEQAVRDVVAYVMTLR